MKNERSRLEESIDLVQSSVEIFDMLERVMGEDQIELVIEKVRDQAEREIRIPSSRLLDCDRADVDASDDPPWKSLCKDLRENSLAAAELESGSSVWERKLTNQLTHSVRLLFWPLFHVAFGVALFVEIDEVRFHIALFSLASTSTG